MVSGDIIQLLIPRKIKKALTFQDGRHSRAEGFSCISLTHACQVSQWKCLPPKDYRYVDKVEFAADM